MNPKKVTVPIKRNEGKSLLLHEVVVAFVVVVKHLLMAEKKIFLKNYFEIN